MRKRGLHHPPTRDSILLKINAIQKARCMDEVGINMESNARLRDSWGPHKCQDLQPCPPLQPTPYGHPRRVKTCVPILKRDASQNVQNASHRRDVSTAPGTRRPQVKKLGSATAGRKAETCFAAGSLSNPGCCMKTSTSLPRINLDPFRK